MVRTTVLAENAEAICRELEEIGCRIIACTLSPKGGSSTLLVQPAKAMDRLYVLGVVHGMEIAYSLMEIGNNV